VARGATALLDRIQAQGRKVLQVVEAEIRKRESEIAELREKAGSWLAAIGVAPVKRPGRPSGSGAAAKTAARKAKRGAYAKVARKAKPKAKKKPSPPVDWDKVLARLSKAFTMADLEKATPALREHRQARNIALARWSRAGAIKKVADGKYRRIAKAG
jgi:hypothetical protein